MIRVDWSVCIIVIDVDESEGLLTLFIERGNGPDAIVR